MTSLGAYAAYWGERRADRDALVFEDRRMCWRDLASRVDAVAAALQGLGVEPGDRVGILLPNCIEWPAAYLAAWVVGAIAVPLNHRFGAFELRAIEQDAGCAVLISRSSVGEPLCDRFRLGVDDRLVIAPRIEGPRDAIGFDDAVAARGKPRPHLLEDDAVAAIFYTSGTTGLPKGTIHTHGSIQASLLSLALAGGFNCEDRGLLVAPLAFTGMALCSLVPMLMSGGCAVIERELVPERMAELIERERITYLMVVPAIWERLARLPDFDARDLSSLRLAGTGGAPIARELLDRYQAKGVVIQQTYGSTEGGGIISLPTAERALAEPTACGPTLLSLCARIVDDAGRDLPAGEIGEILLSGAQVMKGYWRNPEATRQVFDDAGWYRSGDLGRMDATGAITVLDRKKNMIISGGVNIYPAEIERALASLDVVAEVAVIGMADAQWGERVVALVHLRGAAEAADVYREARALLGPIKVPRDIVVLPDPLPRTVTNKLARAELPALYERCKAMAAESG